MYIIAFEYFVYCYQVQVSMKNNVKKLLMFIICLFSCLVYGQGPGQLLSNFNVHGDKNIVRYSPNDNAFINASRNQPPTGYHFTITDLSTMIDAYFQEDFEVRDMEILGDLVFFCGKDMVSSSGIFGWLNIYNLFHGAGDIHIDKSLSAMGLLSLDNIEVFTEQGGRIHVAGYGIHSEMVTPYSYVYTEYRAFEAVGNPATGMQYRVADLYGGYHSDIKDMAVTDNFVVYLKCDRAQRCSPYIGIGVDLEIFQKYNMFSATHFTLGQFQNITHHMEYHPYGDHYCSYAVPDNSDPCSSEAKMVHIEEDKVAVCSYRADLDFSGWSPGGDCLPYPHDDCIEEVYYNEVRWYLANRVYDMAPVLTNNPVVMATADVAQLPSYLDVIEDFVYDNQKKCYVVVLRHEKNPGVLETAFITMDYSLGTPINVDADYEMTVNTAVGWRPTSVCLYGNGEYLVSGNNQISNEHFFLEEQCEFPSWEL